MKKLTAYDLPNDARKCLSLLKCVYRDENGICDEPSINHGNSDAACHGSLVRTLLPLLIEPESSVASSEES